MPSIANMLKEEMRRVARKEVKGATVSLHRDTVSLKHYVADLKRRLGALERDNRRLVIDAKKRGKDGVEVKDDEVAKARITAKMVRAIRAKLNLSQAELAALLGMNAQTVYQWEHKTGRLSFRGNAKVALVAVRKLERKEARQRLDALKAQKAAARKKRPRRK